MTKKKVIEDIIKHAVTARDKQTQKWVPQFYYDQNWILNGYCAYKDAKMPEMEIKSTLPDNVVSKADDMFSDSILRELSEAIEIDKNVLNEWCKTHRRNDPDKVPFIICLKKGTEKRYICINGWYLRNQFEYLKDNRIFIQPDKFRNRFGDAMYIGGVYSFSDDFTTTMCMTLPVYWAKEIKVDCMIEEAA